MQEWKYTDQQQQHMQIQPAKQVYAETKLPFKASLDDGMFIKLFMVVNLYPPGYLPGQELAPS